MVGRGKGKHSRCWVSRFILRFHGTVGLFKSLIRTQVQTPSRISCSRLYELLSSVDFVHVYALIPPNTGGSPVYSFFIVFHLGEIRKNLLVL
jgi:hypothetical protein